MNTASATSISASIHPPANPPGVWATASTYAGRTIRQFIRTPQLLIVNAVTSTMFLLIFRFVFGGAITTEVKYVNFLIPALAAVSGLFAGGAVGVAEDLESGLFDRLRSLPVPRPAVLLGRSLADTALNAWGTVVTLLEKTDALRRPDRFQQLLDACRSDYTGRLGWEDRAYDSPQRLLTALAAVNAVEAGKIAAACADKAKIPERIHAARVNAVKLALDDARD